MMIDVITEPVHILEVVNEDSAEFYSSEATRLLREVFNRNRLGHHPVMDNDSIHRNDDFFRIELVFAFVKARVDRISRIQIDSSTHRLMYGIYFIADFVCSLVTPPVVVVQPPLHHSG